MKASYDDILALGEALGKSPQWFDREGTPRYCEPHPQHCSNIYATKFAVVRIACQACGEEFLVEGYSHRLADYERAEAGREPFPHHFHYGDPPAHKIQYAHHEQPGQCAGDTMNCVDIAIEQLWVRERGEWELGDASHIDIKQDWYEEWLHGDGLDLSPEERAQLQSADDPKETDS